MNDDLRALVRVWQDARQAIDAPAYPDVESVEEWAERRKVEWTRFHQAEEALAAYPA